MESTHVYDPRLDGTEQEVVFVVRFTNGIPMVNHPPELDGRKVCGKRQSGAGEDVSDLENDGLKVI